MRVLRYLLLGVLLTLSANSLPCILPSCNASDPKLDQVITAIQAGGGGGGGGGVSDIVATGSIAALNATVTTGELNGASTLGIEFNGLSASASGNVTVQVSTDGTVWREVGLLQGIDGGLQFPPGVGNFQAAENLHLLTSVTGAKFARVIFDTYVSGSATVTLRASSGSQPFNVGLLHTLINVQNDLDNLLSSGLPYSPGTATSNNQTNGSQLTQIVDSFNDPAQLISDGAGNYNLGVIVVVKTTTSSASGTITTGGTAQTALAANPNRHSLTIYNNDVAETLYFNLTGTASLTLQGSIGITAGGAYSCECTDAVSVIATTTAHKFTIWSR